MLNIITVDLIISKLFLIFFINTKKGNNRTNISVGFNNTV